MVTAVIHEGIVDAVRVAFEGCEVRLPLERPVTVDLLFELTQRFEGMWFEVGRGGELVISGAAGGWSSDIGAELVGQVRVWTFERGRGRARDAQGGYDPPGARPMLPDGSWLSEASIAVAERLGASARRRGYLPITPDFIIEVRSPSQEVARQREKMEDWAAAGVALGMLVDPESRTVWLYRPDGGEFSMEEFSRPASVSCEPEMPGLVLEFEQIWAFPWE